MSKAILYAAVVIAGLVCSCSHEREAAQGHRGIYHWKTTYNPTEWEKQWMRRHKVEKLYVRLFDVEPGAKNGEPEWKMVPVATTRFVQPLPTDIEVVPVVYITVDAIRALDAESYEYNYKELYAKLIVKRIDDMMAEHYADSIHEIQLDCDWTQQTERTYFLLAQSIKQILHKRNITLSGTLRLHQLHELEAPSIKTMPIPFDRSLLMCYNTGRLQDSRTSNSILDFDDVKPYLRQYHSDYLPHTDIAFPVYTWGVDFDGKGNFVRLVNSSQLAEEKCHNLRVESGEPKEIMKTKAALPRLEQQHTVILYHLDSLNLSKYSHEDIEAFYSR